MKTREQKKRVWMPVKRAETFKDKRTKRERTRGAKFRKVLREHE
jgi:hypothetical protein